MKRPKVETKRNLDHKSIFGRGTMLAHALRLVGCGDAEVRPPNLPAS